MPDVTVLIIGLLLIGGYAALNLNWRNKGNKDVSSEIRKKRRVIDALEVGQDVYLYNGCHWRWGKVVRLYPEGIYVQPHQELEQSENWSPQEDVELWFDYDGRGSGEEGTCEDVWYINDLPFAERRRGHV